MKQQPFVLATIFMMLAINVYAWQQQLNTPQNIITNKQLPTFSGAGFFHLNNVSVMKKTKVYGALIANACHFNQLTLMGHMDALHSVVSGKAQITGSLQSTYSTFKKNIKLKGNRITLIHSKTKNITVTGKKDSPPIAKLIDSKVMGNLSFISSPGKVLMDKHSLISGKIIGGEKIMMENKQGDNT
jgi:hypothetical protein